MKSLIGLFAQSFNANWSSLHYDNLEANKQPKVQENMQNLGSKKYFSRKTVIESYQNRYLQSKITQ